MDSSGLDDAQIAHLKRTVERHLAFYRNLETRMKDTRFPVNDPLYIATARVHNVVRDLNNALHYAQVRTGVGR